MARGNVRDDEEFLLLDAISEPLSEQQGFHYSEDELLLGDAGREGNHPFWLGAGKALILSAGLAWLGFATWLLVRRDFRLPALEQIPAAATSLATPLILLGMLYIMLARGSRGEADRFARITTQLRHEAEALDMRLALVNQQLDTARNTMHEQATLLEHYGGSASVNLESAAKTMAQHASTSAQQAEIIERAGLALAHQFTQLIDMMPAVEERAGRISSTLSDGSEAMADKVERMEKRMEALVRLIDEARSRSSGATQSLTAQLLQIQDASRSASEEVNGIADISANMVGAAVDHAKKSLDEIGMTLEMRTADLNVLVKESRIAFENIGHDAIGAYGENISAIETRLQDLDRLVREQSAAISSIGTELAGKIGHVREHFAAMESQSVSGSEQMARALGELERRTIQLDEALQSGNRTAEAMITRSESLLLALDASVRELDEGHPAALARLDEKIGQSKHLLSALTPEIESLEAVSAAILGRAKETEELLGGQGRKLGQWLENGEASLASCQDQVATLQRAMEAADHDARRLTDSSGPQLVATLLRVKETADQAGERARQALSRAITEATSELGDASERALAERLGPIFQARIEEVSAVAERAVQAAHVASDRLMRQLITIADTSGAIEQRIAEATQAAEQREQDHFSRRSAELIEALNSASIDISKILAEDVGDTNWAAYLRGDRGVFTRRAVRLLSSDEAQDVHALYNDDAHFRESVNRYIHDFEAMLRAILAGREGSSLGVTLLSSDIGKLYVALAQGIERLKG